jgi:hypothetical protein
MWPNGFSDFAPESARLLLGVGWNETWSAEFSSLCVGFI